MEQRLTLLWAGRKCGELTVRQEGLYLRLRAVCGLPGGGLRRAFAVGRTGEVRLGILVPEGGSLVPEGGSLAAERRLSVREAAAAGELVRGEVWPVGVPEGESWSEGVFSRRLPLAPELQKALGETSGALYASGPGGGFLLALPYDPRQRFPLETLFCLARISILRGRAYAVYAFDGAGRPLPPP